MLVNAGNGSVQPGPGVAAAHPPVPRAVSKAEPGLLLGWGQRSLWAGNPLAVCSA